jgi:hypothetical protein
MKNDPTTGTWQDDIWCPINIILFCNSDGGLLQEATRHLCRGPRTLETPSGCSRCPVGSLSCLIGSRLGALGVFGAVCLSCCYVLRSSRCLLVGNVLVESSLSLCMSQRLFLKGGVIPRRHGDNVTCKGDLSKQRISRNCIFFQRTKKCLFYRNAPTDKFYFILSHQWHLYFVVPSSLFYVLFSDVLPVFYFILNHSLDSHFDFKTGCVAPSYFPVICHFVDGPSGHFVSYSIS